MPRNYKNESRWEKNKYTLIKGRIDKELGDALKEKLKSKNETVTNWIRTNAKNYVDGVE